MRPFEFKIGNEVSDSKIEISDSDDDEDEDEDEDEDITFADDEDEDITFADDEDDVSEHTFSRIKIDEPVDDDDEEYEDSDEDEDLSVGESSLEIDDGSLAPEVTSKSESFHITPESVELPEEPSSSNTFESGQFDKSASMDKSGAIIHGTFFEDQQNNRSSSINKAKRDGGELEFKKPAKKLKLAAPPVKSITRDRSASNRKRAERVDDHEIVERPRRQPRQRKKKNESYLIYILILSILFLGGILYFNFKILKKPFSELLNPVSMAHAQTLETTTFSKKKRNNLYSEIKLQNILIQPQLSWSGLSLSLVKTKDLEKLDCSISNQSSFLYEVILAEYYQKQIYRDFLDKCSNTFPNDIRALFEFTHRGFPRDAKAIKHLKVLDVSKENVRLVRNIFKVKGNDRMLGELVREVNDILNDDKNINRAKLDQLLHELRRQHSYWNRFLVSSLMFKIGNKGRALENVDWLIKRSTLPVMLDSNRWSKDDVLNPGELLLSIKNIVEYVANNIEFELQRKIFIRSVTPLFPSELSRELTEQFSARWSLKEMRNLINSPNYGKRYLGFWLSELESSVGEKEVQNYLSKYLNSFWFKNASGHDLWFFKFHFPQDDAIREMAVAKILEVSKENDSLSRLLMIELLENDIIKNELSERNEKFKTASFKLKRNYFKKILEAGEGSMLATMELLKLGDLNRDNLWWLIL